MLMAGSSLLFSQSASLTSFHAPANPSDESLAYFRSSANADSEDANFCAMRRSTSGKRTLMTRAAALLL